MSTNPFAAENAWEAGGGFLSAGDYVGEVLEVDGTGSSSGGYPQIELKLGNDLGEIRDWLVITPNTTGKIAQVVAALGVDPPREDEFDPSDLRIKQSYLDREWFGKRVGFLVRSEPDYQDPTKSRDRVKGYVPASKISTRSDIPSDVTPVSGDFRTQTERPDDTLPF